MARLLDKRRTRYEERLQALPASGGGGCHPALLGCASMGVRAGIHADQICEDLRQCVHGTRTVSDREIAEAVAKAMIDSDSPRRTQRTARHTVPGVVFDGTAALRNLVSAGHGFGEADVTDRSPVRIDWPPEEDAARVLEALYTPEEQLFIGPSRGRARIGCEVRPVGKWLRHFSEAGPVATAPHIIPNPLTGTPASLANGTGQTVRGDACVARFRFAVVEFDGLSREDQLAFWYAAEMPVVALIDSGGKSIHGWVRVCDVAQAEVWERVVEQHLFGCLLQPLGVDGACKNESRLSRLPGHLRKETGRWQRILYLAPEGKAVAA